MCNNQNNQTIVVDGLVISPGLINHLKNMKENSILSPEESKNVINKVGLRLAAENAESDSLIEEPIFFMILRDLADIYSLLAEPAKE